MNSDPILDPLPSRYVVGIDLGTTNSAAAYVDTHQSPWQVRTLAISQVVAPGQVEARETLPSFHYEAGAELPAGALQLPWKSDSANCSVGVFARDQGSQTPGRLIASAKSWLSHAGVDRTAALLPWHAADEVARLSPVEASSRYLRHIRLAWNKQFPRHLLEEQDVVLTLPASFDEIARELTVEAAAKAGLPKVMLIEEPQAAFYAWIYKHQDSWETQVSPGELILVCDVGGGTSDFTLIRVRKREDEAGQGPVQFHRIAVGDHLILGGDNLDLALARHLEQKLGETKLAPRQWDALVRLCRSVKETMLSENAPEQMKINLPGGGSKLIGGGLQVNVEQAEVRSLLLDGFFPRSSLNESPQKVRSGFQEMGLPYAPDPGVTRYVSAFLSAHGEKEESGAKKPARPDVVLFNGGLFASSDIRSRMIEVISSWFRTAENDAWSPRILENDRLDLAVARGAAYFGMVRRGEGVKIAASLARSYYIGVEGATDSALCLVPGSAEPGDDINLSQHRFELRVSQPVEFPLFVSSIRLADVPGEFVPVDPEQLRPLPPIRTVLKSARRKEAAAVGVTLNARLTEIGTLELWCAEIEGDRTWRLQFDVRAATQTEIGEHAGGGEQEGFIDEQTAESCRQILNEVFSPPGTAKPGKLMFALSQSIEGPRDGWPAPLLRRLWEFLIDLQAGRGKSAAHEARWLNLLGFSLRPGFGVALDDWRVAETWRMVQGKLAFPASKSELYILWRRLSGGLSRGQQNAIAEPLWSPLSALYRRLSTGKGKADVSFKPEETAEIWRLLGSLELLEVRRKIELGDMILELLPKKKMAVVEPALCWALARIGARRPLYGPLNTVVPVQNVSGWLQRLFACTMEDPAADLVAMQLARRVEDRHLDISSELRKQTHTWLCDRGAPEHYLSLVAEGGMLDHEEQAAVLGDALPAGLRLA